jgi:hypothetical protein
MCELLCAAPHFNFAENIMGVIVGRLSKRSWDEASPDARHGEAAYLLADFTLLDTEL